MPHGWTDYQPFDIPVSVPFGGTGVGTFTVNGVLLGNGGNPVFDSGAGAAGQVLRVPGAGGIPAFGPLDGARVYNDADQTATSGVALFLPFNKERYNNGGVHSTVTNPSRLTATATGVYLITGHILFPWNATGYRELALLLNRIAILDIDGRTADASNPQGLRVSTLYHLSAGDYVELRAYQTSGGDLAVKALGNYSPEFALQALGG
jgi:hypothetical protein